MFLVSWVTRSTLTAGPRVISYLVTVGPRVNPDTVASTSNCSSTSVRARTTVSLTPVLALGAVPGFSSAAGGGRVVSRLRRAVLRRGAAQPGEAFRHPVQRGTGDHQQPEPADQREQRCRDPGGDGRDERRRGEVADEAPGGPDRARAVGR